MDTENKVLELAGFPADKEETNEGYQPIYKVMTEAKIPVSKHLGKLWQSRMRQTLEGNKDKRDAWEECIKYYNHDQMGLREQINKSETNNMTSRQRETENIVFSTINSLVPMLYSKNPTVEITTDKEESKRLATVLERLVNKLFTKQITPGVNLKPKAKKSLMLSLLTNRGVIKIDWIKKNESSTQVLENIKELSKELIEADSVTEVEEIEGKLLALEETIDYLTLEGALLKVVSPFNLLVDPNSREQDGTDAAWMMECDFVPTSFILAKYAKESKDDKKHSTIYDPTHLLSLNSDDDSLNSSVTDNNFKIAGYDSQEAFNKARLTKVWYVWDKTTRRVYMFNDKNWTYPIWVWDDPLELEEFFPYYIMSFLENPETVLSKGETSYYLDQQDAINVINNELSKARAWAIMKIAYNSNVVNPDDVEKFLDSTSTKAVGLNLPEGMRLNDAIDALVPPSVQYGELFDKRDKYEAINRVSGLNEALRGGEFKTNTTNQAIQAYSGIANSRTDEKLDKIEDWIGRIGWGLVQLLLMNMPRQRVEVLIGKENSNDWPENLLTPEDVIDIVSITVVGGSTQKPTNQMKRQQAIEIGQVLGQFVNASPVAILIALKVMERAFDEVVVKEEDWVAIRQSIEQHLQGESSVNTQQSGNNSNIEEIVNNLPPEQQQAIAQLIQQGVPVEQAFQQVTGEPINDGTTQ